MKILHIFSSVNLVKKKKQTQKNLKTETQYVKKTKRKKKTKEKSFMCVNHPSLLSNSAYTLDLIFQSLQNI